MSYRVFHTDVPLPAGVKEPDYSRLITFAHDTLDEALARASALIKIGFLDTGRVFTTGDVPDPTIDGACTSGAVPGRLTRSELLLNALANSQRR